MDGLQFPMSAKTKIGVKCLTNLHLKVLNKGILEEASNKDVEEEKEREKKNNRMRKKKKKKKKRIRKIMRRIRSLFPLPPMMRQKLFQKGNREKL